MQRRGSLVDSITELESSTLMNVLGKRGENADFASGHLGSNLERVVRAAHKPVLVATRAFNPIERFVIAYDGGPSTRKAVDYVATSPLFQGLECHLLKIGADNEGNRHSLETAAVQLQESGFSVQTHLTQGHADDVLADYVKSKRDEHVDHGRLRPFPHPHHDHRQHDKQYAALMPDPRADVSLRRRI